MGNFYFASDADADAEVFFQAELKEMSLMGTMTPPIEKKVTLLNCVLMLRILIDSDDDNAEDHGNDHYDETINYDVQPESSPKPKAVEVAANESGTGAAKEASPASTGRYISVFVFVCVL